MNQKTRQILCIACGRGRVHDFRLLKESKVRLLSAIECLADKGYQGLHRWHGCCRTPHKKPSKARLTSQQRQYNRQLARARVVIEHINRCLKIFRLVAGPYRNRRKRFALRLNLIAGLYNFELASCQPA